MPKAKDMTCSDLIDGFVQPVYQGPVLSDADQLNAFTDEELTEIKKFWLEYSTKLEKEFDPAKEYERVKRHRLNETATISPLWREWGARDNITSQVEHNYSGTLDAQRMGCKSRGEKIKDFEQSFPGAIMCCDSPEQTVAFLLRTMFDHTDQTTFLDRLQLPNTFYAYTHLMMMIAFIGKWQIKFARPSDYEVKMNYKKSVSAIPHPGHPSLPSGHSTVGQAVKKLGMVMFNTPKDWHDLCDEVGTARITEGIHWYADHQAAIDLVEHFHEMVVGKLTGGTDAGNDTTQKNS